MPPKKDTSPAFRGVFNSLNKYKAQIQVRGQQLYLGTYDTAIKAAEAYDSAAILWHGVRAKVNFPDNHPEILRQQELLNLATKNEKELMKGDITSRNEYPITSISNGIMPIVSFYDSSSDLKNSSNNSSNNINIKGRKSNELLLAHDENLFNFITGTQTNGLQIMDDNEDITLNPKYDIILGQFLYILNDFQRRLNISSNQLQQIEALNNFETNIFHQLLGIQKYFHDLILVSLQMRNHHKVLAKNIPIPKDTLESSILSSFSRENNLIINDNNNNNNDNIFDEYSFIHFNKVEGNDMENGDNNESDISDESYINEDSDDIDDEEESNSLSLIQPKKKRKIDN